MLFSLPTNFLSQYLSLARIDDSPTTASSLESWLRTFTVLLLLPHCNTYSNPKHLHVPMRTYKRRQIDESLSTFNLGSLP